MANTLAIRNYFSKLLLVTAFYAVYVINYLLIKSYNIHLYLGAFFDFKFDFSNILLGYVLSVPFVAFILMRAQKNLFAMLLSILVVVGGLPGMIVYSQASLPSEWHFYAFYILCVFLLSLKSRKNINLGIAQSHNVNYRLLLVVGGAGFVFYIYLIGKYFHYLQFRTFSDVYIQRNAFLDVVRSWELYGIAFSKFISAFSFLVVALSKRKSIYLLPIAFIYLADYLLAAHKASLVFLIFAVFYFYLGGVTALAKRFFEYLFLFVVLFSVVLHLAVSYYRDIGVVFIALYDRVFHVTSGLFARNFDFVHTHYFFNGGVGFLGKIFSGVPESSYEVIGRHYFSEGVAANSDLIADGYVNFGTAGAIGQLVVLWLLFGRKDNRIFQENIKYIFPWLFVYSIVLFSMGLQTALLTGGMFFFLMLLKFGFKASPKTVYVHGIDRLERI